MVKIIVEGLIATGLSIVLSLVPLYQFENSGLVTLPGILPLIILTLRWGFPYSAGFFMISSVAIAFLKTGFVLNSIVAINYVLPYLAIGFVDFYKSRKKLKIWKLALAISQSFFIVFLFRMISGFYDYGFYAYKVNFSRLLANNSYYLLVEFVIGVAMAFVIYRRNETMFRFKR